MNELDWQSISVVLIIVLTLAVFVRRFFAKKSSQGCGTSGCHCPKPRSDHKIKPK